MGVPDATRDTDLGPPLFRQGLIFSIGLTLFPLLFVRLFVIRRTALELFFQA